MKHDKPGQFTKEVWKTKVKAHMRGFIRGLRIVNWFIFALGAILLSV